MNNLLYILWITFHLNYVNLQILVSVKYRFNKELLRDNCISKCFDETYSNLIIQLSNYSTREPFSVTIYFSCSIKNEKIFPQYFNLHRFVKLCGDTMEICRDNEIIYWKNIKNISTNNYAVPINITLPINENQIKFQYFLCNEKLLTATLKIQDTVILRNQILILQSAGQTFGIPNHPYSFQMKLSIKKLFGQHVADIFFNVERNITNPFPYTNRSLSTISNNNTLKNDTSSNSFDSYLNNLFEIQKQNKNNKEKLTSVLKMVTNIPREYKKLLNKRNSTYRRKVSKSLIKNVESLMKNVSMEVVNKNQSYQKYTDSFIIYSSIIKKMNSDVVIPLSENKNETSNQFVKINITSNQTINNDATLITNFIRYKNMDIMDESVQIQLKAKNKTLIISDSQNVVERYKNSDIFYLSLSQHINITVKFNLSKLSYYNSPSWLYAFEEECGYLDKNSSWKWAVNGCRKRNESINQYYCECNHLSNFAMLFSVKTINSHHLKITHYFSIFSGIINILSLICFLIFILYINSTDKLRLDQLNITICLLLGTIIFFIGGISSNHEIICKISALITQFFFLSAFNWKLIFGVNVLRMIAFLKYENENRLIKYRIISITISYGLSLIIVIISGILQWQFYGKISENVCWIENQSPAFLTFIIPIGIILLVNIVILLVIAKILIQNFIRNKKIKVNKSSELLIFFQLLVAMGMTWIPSYFATVYLVAIYLWILFFPLQGLLLFIFVVIVNKDNRAKVTSFITQKFSSLTSKYSITTKSPIDSKSTSNIDSRTTQLSPISPNDNELKFPLINESIKEESLIPSEKMSESKFSFNNTSIEKKLLPPPQKKNVSPLTSNNDENQRQKKLLVPPEFPIFFKGTITSNNDENQTQKKLLAPPKYPIFFKRKKGN